MKLADNIQEVSEIVADWKQAKKTIAFVPTMGNLHDGHLSLVEKAHAIADKVVVSIFVNPMQFGPNEDFDAYPRTLELDEKALSEKKVDLLFLPTNAVIYPNSVEVTTQVNVPGLSEILCGAHRPGHFLGVSTIVNKFFNIVQPDKAVFGQKDFQQVAIIKKMVTDLFMPIEIIAMPTRREADGLAMSSRNQYLTDSDRKKASKIYELMKQMADLIKNGAEIAEIESNALAILKSNGFEPEYFSFRDPVTLVPLKSPQTDMVIVVAARLGTTRLIDNWLFSLRNAA